MSLFSPPVPRWIRQIALTTGTLVLTLLLTLMLFPFSAQAQDGKRGDTLTWADAPLVPQHRSEADWLVQMGLASASDMYGPFLTHVYEVGESETFAPLGGSGRFEQTFTLRYRSPHAYWWFERSAQIDSEALAASADFFETHIWPLNNAIFGAEVDPGIDGDPRLHVVNQSWISAGIMGAFSPTDQCPQTICPESNQRDILYISLDAAPLNSQHYLATIAHEHQHLLQNAIDGNEERWFNEGLSQLFEHLNGFDPSYIGSYNVREFLRAPDHHLNGWVSDGGSQGPYYGASYLWMVYLYERFGLDFVQTLANTPYDGLAAVQDALAQRGLSVDVDAVFADWMLANLVDDPYVADGRYYYQTLDLPAPVRTAPLAVMAGGVLLDESVNQYGADYWRLSDPGRYGIRFDGADTVKLIDAPRSDGLMWWSTQNDSGAARLTGAFDLSDLTTATLTLRAWWDIEYDFDWFHVLASADSGQSWDVIGGEAAQEAAGAAPGPNYSGSSGRWVDESIDLSDYAGGSLLLRLEYLTDGGGIRQGIALDTIAIPELNFFDTVDSLDSVWYAEGFLRVPSSIPQEWVLAQVTIPTDGTSEVAWLTLDNMGVGEFVITVPEGGEVVLAVGAMAPFTQERASYTLRVDPLGGAAEGENAP